jgi:hypothetical protein
LHHYLYQHFFLPKRLSTSWSRQRHGSQGSTCTPQTYNHTYLCQSSRGQLHCRSHPRDLLPRDIPAANNLLHGSPHHKSIPTTSLHPMVGRMCVHPFRQAYAGVNITLCSSNHSSTYCAGMHVLQKVHNNHTHQYHDHTHLCWNTPSMDEHHYSPRAPHAPKLGPWGKCANCSLYQCILGRHPSPTSNHMCRPGDTCRAHCTHSRTCLQYDIFCVQMSLIEASVQRKEQQ